VVRLCEEERIAVHDGPVDDVRVGSDDSRQVPDRIRQSQLLGRLQHNK
jgi:hypothetical protein